MTLQELEIKKKDILSRCQHWMSCQDGSYEMALHQSGYDKVIEEIKQLKELENNQNGQ